MDPLLSWLVLTHGSFLKLTIVNREKTWTKNYVFNFHFRNDNKVCKKRQFISYLLLPSLSLLSETFVDLSCLARHWRQHKIDTMKKILVFSKFMILPTWLKSKWPILGKRHGFYSEQVKYFYLAIMNFVYCTHLQNKWFALKFKFQRFRRNASKFPIFI